MWVINFDFFDDSEVLNFINNYERSLKAMPIIDDSATQVKKIYDQLRANLNGAQLAALAKMINDNLSDPAMTKNPVTKNNDALEARQEYITQVDNRF